MGLWILAPISCDGEVTVDGLLERVDLGGEPGTRGAYAGWAVHLATVTCR